MVRCCLLVLSAGCGATPWPDPVSDAAPGSRPDARPADTAVIVGIEDYAHLPDIRGAADNARDWQRYLRTVRGLPSDRIHLVLDDKATREGILAALSRATDDVREGGRVWFVFIGHGAPRTMRGPGGQHEGLLVAADARRSAQSIDGNSISQAELAVRLGEREHVVVLDACFAGTDRDARPLVADLGLQIVELSTVPSGSLLTATESSETAALLTKSLRPAFSLVALGALQGWCEGRYEDAPADGRVTGPEVARCAGEIIRAVNRDKHSPQFHATGDEQVLTLAEGIGSGYDLDATLQAVNDAGPPSRAGATGLLVVGGIGLAVGIGAHVVNARAHDEWRLTDVKTERVRYRSLLGDLSTSYDVAVAGYVFGGMAVAGGLVWRLMLLGEDADWLAVSPTGRGVVWGGTF